MPTCNKIRSPSKITGFNHFEIALLSLDKVFLYRFSMRQRANYINFKEMTAIFLVIAR